MAESFDHFMELTTKGIVSGPSVADRDRLAEYAHPFCVFIYT